MLPGARVSEWESVRDGVIASMAPVGAVEVELACRVAALQWRLRRAIAFEAAAAAVVVDPVALAAAREDVAESETDLNRLRGVLTLPDDHPIGGADALAVLRSVDAHMPYADESYTDLKDPEVLAGLGLPEGRRGDPAGWDEWTIGLVRDRIEWIAEGYYDDADGGEDGGGEPDDAGGEILAGQGLDLPRDS